MQDIPSTEVTGKLSYSQSLLFTETLDLPTGFIWAGWCSSVVYTGEGKLMPMYDWVARCCGMTASAIREIDARNTPPEGGCTCGKNDWEREIGNGVSVSKSDSWGGKGNW